MSKNNRMHRNINIRNTFFSEVGFGISANVILLLFHFFIFVLRLKPKSTDLPIGLLALVHLAMLITTGYTAMDIFGYKNDWDDITCKCLILIYRLVRGLSVCLTCLLSILQAITLSPRSSCLAKFKHRSLHHSLCLLLLLWVFYISISSHLLISIIATPNLTSENLMYVSESCSLSPLPHPYQHVFSRLLTFREVLCMGLMAFASGYMVLFLFRHKRQSRHLHRTSLTSKTSPEQRATRTILLLLSFFMAMSILDSLISYSRLTLHDDPIFYCIQLLEAHSYATVSPLVFISTEKRIIIVLRSICKKGVSS
ncbi:vomeronasal type-1 receptor 94-like [Dipodomys spectabilis]|uniref:vomeronasal type-1 receptor 94-like n=1 Tax=Dipodomys spectabilis TaxID=105255 RepID=UPI001C546AFA|nr:vomeronasal type-1 receptor 94-like [Dipodomys spectabilis]